MNVLPNYKDIQARQKLILLKKIFKYQKHIIDKINEAVNNDRSSVKIEIPSDVVTLLIEWAKSKGYFAEEIFNKYSGTYFKLVSIKLKNNIIENNSKQYYYPPPPPPKKRIIKEGMGIIKT